MSDVPIIGDVFPKPKPMQGVPVRRVVRTIDGKTLVLTVVSSQVRRSAHGLDPFSREGYVSTRVAGRLLGFQTGEYARATLKIGYSVGYPVTLFPDGVDVTLSTPSVQITGQVDASINPQITISPSGGGGGIGQIGGQLGAQVNLT